MKIGKRKEVSPHSFSPFVSERFELYFKKEKKGKKKEKSKGKKRRKKRKKRKEKKLFTNKSPPF